MKKKLLYITLLFLSVEGNVMAQQQMYICRAGQADAYEINCMTLLQMETDTFRIRQQPPYAIEDVDSIVFQRPALTCWELGWWGDMTNGQSKYKARLKEETNVIMQYVYESFDYDVLFIVETQDSICQSVRCELHFSEEWMSELFLLWVIGMGRDGTTGGGPGDDPYIYVKETGTGPRRFETWLFGFDVLPYESDWMRDGTMLWSDCSNLLAGRPIEDVQIIIEAWVHQPLKLMKYSDYINLNK